MIVQAEVSLYPLRTSRIGKIVATFVAGLSRPGLAISKGNMSTVVEGEVSDVLAAVNAAFVSAASTHAVVMALKISNACPSGDLAEPGYHFVAGDHHNPGKKE